MSEQSKALAVEYAEILESRVSYGHLCEIQIAAELRRLVAENAEMKDEVRWLKQCRENDALRAQLADPQQAPLEEREAFEARFVADDYHCTRLLYLWEGWQARAALKPAVPEGYQLVPIKPTNKMIKAAWSMLEENVLPLSQRDKIICAYKSMLEESKDGQA